ncbi:MAG TPA: hypothetical protein VHF69_01460 [Candidatus Synoicihabitans sp.]|nr:hypothetical protein [Candidatus Synoicihabitans sp.]
MLHATKQNRLMRGMGICAPIATDHVGLTTFRLGGDSRSNRARTDVRSTGSGVT